jgi:DNA-binding transcriptional LysR family regulator
VSLEAIESKAQAMFGRQRVLKVTLLASQLMSISWLPKLLATFKVDNPTIQVTLILEDSQ